MINGSGASGQPLGIINTSGIGSVSGASLAYADVLEFQEDVTAVNALINPESSGYVATGTVASLLMQRVKFASTASPLWEGSILDGEVAGFKAMSSSQLPAANMIFGDWSQVVIGEWGVLEFVVNPFANFQAA